tara:strand:+ start:32599 stop:33195 length:597 start_codon:yes stop_codon:yes gene_type:complete
MVKRYFDFVLSFFGLLVLLPLFVIVALLIKLDSAGPVFYRQERVGRFGKIFLIHKFRTMSVRSDKDSQLTIGDDVRITRVGSFLRKYKIDELPQLIDVLRGRMSIVGPRPEVEEFMNLYPPDIREKVLSVRPGITDLASIEMIDENSMLAKFDDPRVAYIEKILPVKQRYYTDYVKNRNIVFDIKIIFLTIRKILVRN